MNIFLKCRVRTSAQIRTSEHGVQRELIAVEIVQHDHVERRRGRRAIASYSNPSYQQRCVAETVSGSNS